MTLTLVQLQYALAVEEHRHFGQAAKACHVTQPTLSQQLQKLEEDCSIVLFDRSKKPILPTPEGEAFLKQAKKVMQEVKRLHFISEEKRYGALSGDFKLAIIPTIAGDLLPLFLARFAELYPKVTLQIEELKTEAILSDLQRDRLDGAILATPIEGSEKQFYVHPLYYEPFYLYFSSGHELLKKSAIERRQLDLIEMWLLQDGHCFKDQVMSFCALPGKRVALLNNVRFQSGSLDTLRKMVVKNGGFTMIPALMSLQMSEREREKHVRPFVSPMPSREVSLIYRRDHWKLDLIKAIENTIAESLPAGIQRRRDRQQKIIAVC